MSNKPLKTESFYGFNALEGAHKYKDFIRDNPNIEIVSTMVIDGTYVLLTYR